MGTTGRLGNHLINQPQGMQGVRRHSHGSRGLLGVTSLLPENRGTAFWRDHRVHAVLQHGHVIADPNGQRAAGASLTDDRAQDRRTQLAHLKQIAGNRFALIALLRSDARVRPRRIDEGQDRQRKLFRHLHQAQGLAVALWAGHAEVSTHFFLGIAALLMTDHHYRAPFKAGQPADQGLVIAEVPIPMEFGELGKQMADVEERFAELTKQLPTEKEVPGLLDDITNLGTDSGLQIGLIALAAEAKREFYIELPINIRVKGSYHQLGGFVSGIAALDRIVTLHDYSISPTGGEVAMNIQAKTYRYNEPK